MIKNRKTLSRERLSSQNALKMRANVGVSYVARLQTGLMRARQDGSLTAMDDDNANLRKRIGECGYLVAEILAGLSSDESTMAGVRISGNNFGSPLAG